MILKVADFKEPNDIFDLICSGEKSIDTRPYSTKFDGLRAGDEIIFKHVKTGEAITKQVKRVSRYKSLDELIKNKDISKIISGAKTKEDLLRVYKKFRGFVEKMEERGIVAIELI